MEDVSRGLSSTAAVQQANLEAAEQEAGDLSPARAGVVFEILTYPDKKLRVDCAPVDPEWLATPDAQGLLELLKNTMYAHNGIGLAAPQVGWPQRVIVIDPWSQTEEERSPVFLINPEIIDAFDNYSCVEACLSVPGLQATVQRFRDIVVKRLNEKGEEIVSDWSEFDAAVIQHEIDHLNGVLFIDKMSALKRDIYDRKVRKMKKLARVIAKQEIKNG